MFNISKILIFIAALIAVWQLITIDFGNLSSSLNVSKYIMIVSMLLLCMSMVLSMRREKEE